MLCSKNYEPVLNDLPKITSWFHTYFHYTITTYGKEIEPGVPSSEESIGTLKRLSDMVGKQRVAWRYDPVLQPQKAFENDHLHDPNSPLPLGHLKETNTLQKRI